MRLFYGSCQLVQEQKGVLEPPELPPGYATVQAKVGGKEHKSFFHSWKNTVVRGKPMAL